MVWNPGREKHGFTLVELLVVIATIALLMGILLPTLGAARDAASNSQCRANLRQVAFATRLYVEDHDGYLPYTYLGPGASESLGEPESFMPWFVRVGSQAGSTVPQRASGYVEFKPGVMTGFVWHCPFASAASGMTVSGDLGASHYGMNLETLYRRDNLNSGQLVRFDELRSDAAWLADSAPYASDDSTFVLSGAFHSGPSRWQNPWPSSPQMRFDTSSSTAFRADVHGGMFSLAGTDTSVRSVKSSDSPDWPLRVLSPRR